VWGVIDGEAVAAGDDGGHVYVLGVIEPSPDNDRLCLDVVADWQVTGHRRSITRSIVHSFIDPFIQSTDQPVGVIEAPEFIMIFVQQCNVRSRRRGSSCSREG